MLLVLLVLVLVAGVALFLLLMPWTTDFPIAWRAESHLLEGIANSGTR